MSVAETAAPRRFSTRFYRSELRLHFGRRRNWAGLAVLATVPIIIAVAAKLSAPGSDDGPQFFSAITNNGLFVVLAALTLEAPLFLPLAVAAISSDTIAGEANLGTLRYLLAAPVHRTRLLAVKFAAVVTFALAVTMLIAVVGGVLGLILFGPGDMVLLSGSTIGFGEGLGRVLLVCLYLTAWLSAIGAIGMFVSSLTEQPLGATIAVLIFVVVSFILQAIPKLSWLAPYLLTNWMNGWGDLLRDPIATDSLGPGLLAAGAYIIIFWTAAWARFTVRDITS